MNSRVPGGVRWILFDAVGTLIYPDPPVAEAYHDVARDFQSQLTVADIEQRFRSAFASEFHNGPGLTRPPTTEQSERNRWRRIVTAVLEDVRSAGSEPFERLWQHFASPASWRVLDDVPAAVAALQARGFRLGIASNFDSRLHQIVAGHAPLAACERVFVSSEIGFSKPDGRFFSEVQRQLAAGGEEILLVGDDYVNDWLGATSAGWRALLIEREAVAAAPGSLRRLGQLAS
jgi:putative hydrolase of the HAD superfamily